MHFGAHMVGDEADDAFAVGGGEAQAGIGDPVGEPVDPQPPVGIEHDLDHARVFQPTGDVGTQRRAQHARAAGEGFAAIGHGPHVENLAGRRRPHRRDRFMGTSNETHKSRAATGDRSA